MVRAARRLLYMLLPADIRDDVVAELDAEYARAILPSRSSWQAVAWYWRQAAGSIGPALAMRRRRRNVYRGDVMHKIVARWSAEAWQDLTFALRLFARQKMFAAAVVATLALGIGATTAMFSVVDAVLIRPLPYHEPDRLLRIWSANPRGIPRNQISPPDFFDWREQVRGLEALAGFSSFDVTLSSAGEPVRLAAASATANLASTFGVQPMLGRWFVDGETRGDGDPVAVIGERLWRERYNADPAVVGRSMVVDGASRTIVGVMPRSFQFPGDAHRIWLPLGDALRKQSRSARFLGAVGRLSPGATIDTARESLLAVTQQLAATYPDNDRGWSVTIATLSDAVRGDVRRPLLILLAAIAAVLLIACANVTGLLLARGVTRSRELAVRAAVGATRSRLLRMQLVEATALALMGGAVGIALAAWSLQSVQLTSGLDLPLLDRVALDRRGVWAALGLSLACALATGLWPAWKASRRRGADALESGSRTTGGHLRLRHAIVLVQVAVATTLVAAGALLIGSFQRLTAVPAGFTADRTLLADVALPAARYPRDARDPFFTALLERIRALPSVQTAGAGGPLPLSGLDGLLRFGLPIEGVEPTPDRLQRAYLRWATPGYFEAMGIELKAGRAFTASDSPSSLPVVVVDTELARRYFGGGRAIGRRIRGPMDRNTWREVVGVVGAVRQSALDREPEPHMYVPQAQFPSPDLTLVVRTAGDATALAPDLRRILAEADRTLPLSNMRPLSGLVADSAAPRRIGAVLLSAFAAAAVLLTLVGLYGVVAQLVTESTREIGVRIAMGATEHHVVALLVVRALKVTIAGVVAGVGLALFATPALQAMLYGIGPRDPVTLAATAIGLTSVAAVAAYVPARRILRLDVVNALRVDG
jgi:putative ABC transport system permease protein